MTISREHDRPEALIEGLFRRTFRVRLGIPQRGRRPFNLAEIDG